MTNDLIERETWWKTVIGEGQTHVPSGEVPSIKHLHPLTVKPIYDAHKGTAVADVIAGLIFNLSISREREEYLVADLTERRDAAEKRADEAAAHIEALAERVRELEGALERQTDNMAFVLNRVDLRAWGDRFEQQMTEDRQLLPARQARKDKENG
jgi:hypothetical protein